MIKDTLAAALAGKFTRFDVFKGPIKDNKGNVIVADGEDGAGGHRLLPKVRLAAARLACIGGTEGVTAELPKLN